MLLLTQMHKIWIVLSRHGLCVDFVQHFFQQPHGLRLCLIVATLLHPWQDGVATKHNLPGNLIQARSWYRSAGSHRLDDLPPKRILRAWGTSSFADKNDDEAQKLLLQRGKEFGVEQREQVLGSNRFGTKLQRGQIHVHHGVSKTVLIMLHDDGRCAIAHPQAAPHLGHACRYTHRRISEIEPHEPWQRLARYVCAGGGRLVEALRR